MKIWKFGFAAVCTLSLSLPACGSSDEGDDTPGGTGGTRAGGAGKGGAGSGGKAGSSSAGTSSAGKSGSGSGGSNGSGGSKGSTGGSNASGGSDAPGGADSGGTNASGGTGGAAECDPEAIAMNPTPGAVPEGCEAYAECVEPCTEAINECFAEGGACYGYLSCIGDCDCETNCVIENCISELSTECSLCVLPASTCSADCQDEAESCM